MPGSTKNDFKFLSNGGESGKLIADFDWSKHPIGPIDTWPISLKNSVSNMLRTNFPMLVLWGKDFTCFHNDAFLPSLTVAQRPAIGKKAMDVWSEGWDFVGPHLTKVLSTGEAVTFENQPVTNTRDGFKKDIYWTFCYSLLLDDNDEHGGVLVTCMDTTSLIDASKRLDGREKSLDNALQNRAYETVITETPDLMYVFDLQYKFSYANRALLTMWGKTWDTAIGKGLRENGYEEWHALMHEREIDQVAATGNSVRGVVSFPHAVLGSRVYDYILIPVFDQNGKVAAVAGTTRDISEIKQIENQLRESEERFRTLISQAPVAIAVFRGDDFVAEVANDAYLQLVDKKQEEFVNIPLFTSLPLVRPVVEPLVQNVLQTGQPYIGTEVEVMLHRQGKNAPGYFNLTYSPIYGKSGHPDGFMVIATEVTAQVLARRKVEESERELRNKEAELANAIELAELATWKLEGASRHLVLSPRYAEMFGVNKSSITLTEALALIDEDDRDNITAQFENAMHARSRGRFDAEYRIRNASTGNAHIIHAIGQTIFDINGKFVRIEGTAQDVTVQRELQLALEIQVQIRTEELQATNEELTSANENLFRSREMLVSSNEQLSQFAFVASHDLQEPVRKISVFVEMIHKILPEMNAQTKKYLDKIDISANRMSHLIRDILAHSQISDPSQQFELVNLENILANSIVEFDEQIREHKANIQSDPLPSIEGIEVQLGQLFSNLISNALKFSYPEKPFELKIKSEKLTTEQKKANESLSPQKEYYRISFIDNGIGFDQSHADQIFEIFQRLHSKSEYSGTGIGLATCKKIAQNHGGYISAISSPGNGATFEVILPASQGQ